jgi:hypothetical protein
MPYVVTTKRPCLDCFDGISKEPDPALVADPEVPWHMTWKPCETCADETCPTGYIVSRRAVATLEEARIYASTWITDRWSSSPAFARGDGDLYRPETRPMVAQADALPESGGTVGPLPDGTVIEVEVIWWEDLRERAGLDRDALTLDAQTIAAFNAHEAA